MRTVAMVSQKGGSGKSTLAACLAVAAMEGETGGVVLLDLDPQGSIAAWADDRESSDPAIDSVAPEAISTLPDIVAAFARRGFTYLILDCPGVASSATNAAMRVADLCLVPARPTSVDLRATRPTIAALVAMKREFAFVLNQAPTTSRSTRTSEAASGLAMLGVLADPVITQRADYQDAMSVGLGVTEYAPAGKAAEEIRGLWHWIEKKLGDRK